MAKKKKRYGYKDGDENARFAPGGSAASEWEEQQRQSFTMGRTINPSDTSKRFNTEQDVENYKPIKTETYQSYMAQKLAQAKANNPKSRVHITANDLSSYSNARAKLFNIDPAAELKSQSEFTSQYKSSVDKKARLNDMVQLAQGLDINNAQDLVRKSYNDLGAVEGLANTRTNAEGLLKRVEEYRKLYGDSKELRVLEDRAKGITDYINTNAKGGSAVSNAAYEELQAPTIQKKEEVRAKYNAINNANIEEKYGKAGDLGYEGVKNIKAETPAEADWKEEKQLQLDPIKKYEDNKKEIEKLEKEDRKKQAQTVLSRDPLGILINNTVGGNRNSDKIYELQDQNTQILAQYAEDIIAKANLTEDERRKLETGRSFDLSDNEFRWDVGTNAKNEVTLNRKEMIDVLSKRGISKEEASLLLDYEKELDKENERQAAINAGELKRRTDSELGNLTEDIARTIGQPIISPLERVMGVSGEYAHAEQLGRQQAREKYYEDDAIGKALYDFGETAGTIVGASLLGGAAAVPFTTKAVEDSYYNALDKGASESDAMNYAATNGIMTGIIYGIGLKGVNKLLSKSVKGSVVEGLAKEIVEGKPTSSLGKAILKNVGTNALKEGGIFAGLTTTTQVADTLNQVINLGKKSDFNQMVEAYKQQGMSEDEAWQNTVLDISKQIGQGAVESFASGAIMGAGGALIGGARQAKTYNKMRDRAETLKGEYEKFTADTTSPYFENVTDQAELESQYRQRAKELHPDVAEGNEEAFNQLVQDKQRIEGILTGERSNEARTAIDNWENFVNEARDILGLDRVLTTKEREKFAEDFADTKTKLLEVRNKLKSETPKSEKEAAEIEEIVSNIDNEISRVDNAVEATADIVVPEENAMVEQPIETVDPTYAEPIEAVETPTERAESVDLSNLNDRQSEIAQKGTEHDLPEKAIKSMLANDNNTISPEEYALGYSEFYLMGKSSNAKSISEAIAKVPSLRETANRITPQAAGVAFSEGKAEVPVREIKSMLNAKPSGTFKAESEAKDMDERYVHRVLENVAKISGADVLVVDDMSKYNVPKNTQGFAVTNKGKVILNKDTANILGVGVHEIVGHIGKKFAPKSYEVFESITEKIARDDLGIRGFDKNIKDLQTEYGKAGQSISYEDAKEEAVAYLAETMLLNDKIRDKFIEETTNANISEAEKKHIIQTILDWIKNAIKALKDRVANARVRQGTESVLKDELVNADETVDAMIKVLEETKAAFENAEIGEVSENSTEVKNKFSLSEPVEETKDLVAVHNLHEDDLENSLDLGGFAMPSIAVIKAENGHNNYGAISVVFYKDTIDPANKQNKVYSGDAWTPTFPETNYKLDEKVREQLSDKIADLVGKQAFSELRNTLDYDNMQDTINRQGGDYINAYKREPIMKLAYLRDTGKKFDIPMEDKHYGKKVDLLERVLEYAKNKNYDIKDLWNSEYETYENDGIIDDLRDLANKYKQDNIVKELRDKGKDKDTLQKAAKHKFYTTENFGFAQAETMLHSAYRLNEDLKNGGIPQVIDTYATSDKLDEIVDNEDKKYNEWLEKTFNGIIEKKGIRNSTELFTPSGYRRDWEQLYDSVTLDNIVKAMRRDIPKGAGFLGAGQPTAAATYEFEDIDDIKSRKDQLKILPEEEYNKIHENLIDRFSELVDRYNIKKDDEFGSRIDAGHVLSENIAKSRTLDQLKQNLEKDSKYGYYYSEDFAEDVWDLVEDMQDTPTGYFEAKPQRAVRLDEIAYTIVPNNTSKELLNKLDENNIEYKTYEKGNEEQRKELLNDERVKFSLSEEKEDAKKSLVDKDTEDKLERFQQITEDIGRQFKLVPGSKLDAKQTRKLALDFKNKLDSDIDTFDLAYQLKALGTLIESKKGNIENTDVKDKTKQIVRDIMKNAKHVDPEVNEALKYLRSTKLQVTDKIKQDIPDYGYFRKSNFGTLNLTNDGEPIDTWISEAASLHPYPFSEWVDLTPSDILQEIADWAYSAKDGSYTMYDMGGEDAVDFYALELLNDYANANIEDITNNKAKQRELYENVSELYDFAKEQATQVGKERENAQYRVNQAIENYKKNSGEIRLRLDEQKRELQNEFSKTMEQEIAKVKTKANERQKKAIARLKADQRARNKKVKDRSLRTEKKQVIRRTLGRIETTLKKPTVHKYVPQPLQRPVIDLVLSLKKSLEETAREASIRRDNAYVRYTGEKLKQELEKIDKRENKWVDDLNTLKKTLEMYVSGNLEDKNGNKLNNPYGDSDTYFGPLVKMIQDFVMRNGKTPLKKMNLEQLQELSNLTRAIEKTTTERERPQNIKIINKETNKPYETYKEISNAAIKEIEKYKVDGLDKKMLPMLNARSLLKLIGGHVKGGVADQLADQLDERSLVKWGIEKDLNSKFDKVISEKADKKIKFLPNIKFKSEEVRRFDKDHLYNVGFKDNKGETVLHNKDNLLDIYMHLLDDDNMTHIAGGGINIPAFKKYYANKSHNEIYSEANGAKHTANLDEQLKTLNEQISQANENEDWETLQKLAANKANLFTQSKKDLREIKKNIEDTFTDYDKKLIKTGKEIKKQITDMLNDYWEEHFGYRPFFVENHWHISVDPDFISGDSGKRQEVITNLSEQGFTIARQKNATNPIDSGSFIDNIYRDIEQAAKTIAYAGWQRDFNAIYKYTHKGPTNWQNKVRNKLAASRDYFDDAQLNIFGGKQNSTNRFDKLAGDLRSGAISGAVNRVSVGVAQVWSGLGVRMFADKKAMANAFNPKNKISRTVNGKHYSIQDVIDEYTPIMWARGNSGFSLETQDLKRDTNKFFKARRKADILTHGWIFNLPTHFDSGTLHFKFRALLDYVRRTRPDLKEGTPEQIVKGESPLYKEVAKIFNECVMLTDPMFDAVSKNYLQSSRSEIVKSLASVFKTEPYQMANLLYNAKKGYDFTKNDKNATKKEKSKAFKFLKGAIAFYFASTTLYAVAKMAYKKLWGHDKREITPGYVAKNLISAYTGFIPLSSQLIDLVYNKIEGIPVYNVEIMGTQLLKDAGDFADAISKFIADPEANISKFISNIEQLANDAGMPIKNLHDEVDGIYRNIEDYMDNQERDYSNEKTDSELYYAYATGEYTKKDLKELGLELNDTTKTKVSNAIEKALKDNELSHDQAVEKLKESELFTPSGSYKNVPYNTYIEGKVARWEINAYKEDYQNSLTSGGAETSESRQIRQKIADLNWRSAFYSTENAKKSPSERLNDMFKKWRESRED